MSGPAGAVLAGLLLLGLSGSLADARAGSLGILPVRVQVADDGRPAVLRLENLGRTTSLVQVETFGWPRADAPDDLVPTHDLIAVPAVFALEPGAVQIVRVALRAPQGLQREATYRLLVTEVPEQVGRGDGVNFAVRMNLPVFAAPSGAAPEASWHIEPTGRDLRLVVRNEGAAHLRLDRVVLRGKDGRAVLDRDDVVYVHAGQSHAWTLPDAGPANGRYALRAESNIGALDVAIGATGS
jgi:fimbrial chaperone protein